MKFLKSLKAKDISLYNAFVVKLILIVLTLWGLGVLSHWGNMLFKSPFSGGYQIVFLNNSQFYFCKVTPVGKDYLKCSDAYYIRNEDEQYENEEGGLETRTTVKLTKLGSREVYNPESTMIFPSDKVVLVENFEPESEMLKAILEQEANITEK